jgi:acyl-CoA thioesterase FadM
LNKNYCKQQLIVDKQMLNENKLYEHEFKVRVRYSETDQMGVVYHGNYAQYFEMGAWNGLGTLGFL